MKTLLAPSANRKSRQLESLYAQFRSMAAARMRRLPAQTLGATDVVHEAVARILRSPSIPQDVSDGHMRALVARAMKNVLVDRARMKSTRRRSDSLGGLSEPLEGVDTSDSDSTELLRDAVQSLAKVDSRAARVVELRFMGGMTEEEVAAALGVTDRTVRRDWRFARAWLFREVANEYD